MPYVNESKHHDQLVQMVRLYNAADEALQVLSKCIPTNNLDEADILRARNMLHNALGRDLGAASVSEFGPMNEAEKLDLIRNLMLRAKPDGMTPLDLTEIMSQVSELTAR